MKKIILFSLVLVSLNIFATSISHLELIDSMIAQNNTKIQMLYNNFESDESDGLGLGIMQLEEKRNKCISYACSDKAATKIILTLKRIIEIQNGTIGLHQVKIDELTH